MGAPFTLASDFQDISDNFRSGRAREMRFQIKLPNWSCFPIGSWRSSLPSFPRFGFIAGVDPGGDSRRVFAKRAGMICAPRRSDAPNAGCSPDRRNGKAASDETVPTMVAEWTDGDFVDRLDSDSRPMGTELHFNGRNRPPMVERRSGPRHRSWGIRIGCCIPPKRG
jgi:hypothetical protein